jgi:hypothetical protein
MFSFNCSWTDADGNVIRPATRTVQCPYSLCIQSALPIAQGLPAGTELDIPFTGMIQSSTLMIIQNFSGQELGMAWGGNFSPNLPAGGLLIRAFPAPPTSNPILGLRFFLTEIQATAGKVNYTLLGT